MKVTSGPAFALCSLLLLLLLLLQVPDSLSLVPQPRGKGTMDAGDIGSVTLDKWSGGAEHRDRWRLNGNQGLEGVGSGRAVEIMVLVKATRTGDPQGHHAAGTRSPHKSQPESGAAPGPGLCERSAGDQVSGQFPQPFPGLGSGSPEMLSN